ELGVGHHRADPVAAVLALDAVQPGDLAEVHEQCRRGDPELHQRDQRVAARERLRVVAALREQADRLVERVGRGVVELHRDHAFASWIASHTRIGLSGMFRYVTPSGRSASTVAFTTAGEQAIVPASPTPLTPSELTGDG